jgi:hypothetical protein
MKSVSAVFILCILVSCGSAPQTSQDLARSDALVTNLKSAPPEYQLLYLDSGHLPRGNDPAAARIRALLREVSGRTKDDERHIADRTSRAVTVLNQDGIPITNEEFLGEAKAYFTANGPQITFDDLSSTLALGLRAK